MTRLARPANAPRGASIGRVRVPGRLLVHLPLGVLLAAQATVAPAETAEAREQARLCEKRSLAPGVEACRAALALGIGPPRRAAIREQLARQLAALEDWDALAELYREGVRLEPQSAIAWQRLGLTLLFALAQPAEAVSALEEAVKLAPQDAEARLGLAQALVAQGRGSEAAAAFEAALRLDPAALEGRPAAQAAFEAVRRGAAWP
jgi:tetratricopeptide (TPR) repeat protein